MYKYHTKQFFFSQPLMSKEIDTWLNSFSNKVTFAPMYTVNVVGYVACPSGITITMREYISNDSDEKTT